MFQITGDGSRLTFLCGIFATTDKAILDLVPEHGAERQSVGVV